MCRSLGVAGDKYMKDFLLFCVECVVGFLRYIVGTIIAGIGFVMVLDRVHRRALAGDGSRRADPPDRRLDAIQDMRKTRPE